MSRCYTPIEIQPKLKHYNGQAQKTDSPTTLVVPCGQCQGCRMNRAEGWTARMMHEAQLHEHNSFITLTYSDEHLPPDGSLAPDHVTKFFKKLRKALKGKKILYYYCGEYGENFSRPHYHIALFGYDFSSDRIPHRQTEQTTVYRSPLLEKLWPYGFSEIGQLEYDSCRYVAGYIQKKVTGKKAPDHYQTINQEGEILPIHPEFARMSRRPAIGLKWLECFQDDIYNQDVCIVGEKKLRPPSYYDKWLKKTDESRFIKIKTSREASMISDHSADPALLIKTYHAKVIASKKFNRSLEGSAAPIPDEDRLGYFKTLNDENHLKQKRKKNGN